MNKICIKFLGALVASAALLLPMTASAEYIGNIDPASWDYGD
jgi:hypothetical protein